MSSLFLQSSLRHRQCCDDEVRPIHHNFALPTPDDGAYRRHLKMCAKHYYLLLNDR